MPRLQTDQLWKLLPPNATDHERDYLAVSPFDNILDPETPHIHRAKLIERPDSFLPWLILEYGLGNLAPWLTDPRVLIEQGLLFLRERGTPAGMLRALGWVGFEDAEVWEHDRPSIHFPEYQLDLGRVPDDLSIICDIATIARIAQPVRSRLRRVFHGWDVRRFRLNSSPWGDLLGGESGVYLGGVLCGGKDPQIWASFGRRYRNEATFLIDAGPVVSMNRREHLTYDRVRMWGWPTLDADFHIAPPTYAQSHPEEGAISFALSGITMLGEITVYSGGTTGGPILFTASLFAFGPMSMEDSVSYMQGFDPHEQFFHAELTGTHLIITAKHPGLTTMQVGCMDLDTATVVEQASSLITASGGRTAFYQQNRIVRDGRTQTHGFHNGGFASSVSVGRYSAPGCNYRTHDSIKRVVVGEDVPGTPTGPVWYVGSHIGEVDFNCTAGENNELWRLEYSLPNGAVGHLFTSSAITIGAPPLIPLTTTVIISFPNLLAYGREFWVKVFPINANGVEGDPLVVYYTPQAPNLLTEEDEILTTEESEPFITED